MRFDFQKIIKLISSRVVPLIVSVSAFVLSFMSITDYGSATISPQTGSEVSDDEWVYIDDEKAEEEDLNEDENEEPAPADETDTEAVTDVTDPAGETADPVDPSVTDNEGQTTGEDNSGADAEQPQDPTGGENVDPEPAQDPEPAEEEVQDEPEKPEPAVKPEQPKNKPAKKKWTKKVDTSKTDSLNDATPKNVIITPSKADVKSTLSIPASPIDASEITGSRLRKSGKYAQSLKDDYKVEFSSDFAIIMEEIEDEFEFDHDLITEDTYEMRKENLEKGVVFAPDDGSSVAKAAFEDDVLYLSEDEVDLLLDEEIDEQDLIDALTVKSYHYTNWADILAVYAYRQFKAGAEQVTYNEKAKKALAALFEEMNQVEIIDEENKVALYTNKTVEDYLKDKEEGAEQEEKDKIKKEIEKFVDPAYVLLCAAESGSRQLTLAAYDLTEAEDPDNPIPDERKNVVLAAQTLNGKVSYFWGGKYNNLGWNKRWSTPQTVSSPGSKDFGSTQLYGLDCSGFVSWAFINGFNSLEVNELLGQGTASQWVTSEPVAEEDAKVGDLVFLRVPSAGSINHVGILVGQDKNGDWIAIHCNASDDNVSVERAYDVGFRYIRRPYLYQDDEEDESTEEPEK